MVQNELTFFISNLESGVETKFIHYAANAKLREELFCKHWRMGLKLICFGQLGLKLNTSQMQNTVFIYQPSRAHPHDRGWIVC